MKITQLFTEQKEREIDLDTPAFFTEYRSMIAVYSEDKVVSALNLSNGFHSISKCAITEEEFNAALAEAVMNIAGVEIAPNSVTEEITA
jgi:hypothetical protein